MYLSRLTLSTARRSLRALDNWYLIHQNVAAATEHHPGRALFRVDESTREVLVQTSAHPDWASSFGEHLYLLKGAPEVREHHLELEVGARFVFRLLAQPIVNERVAEDRRGIRTALVEYDRQMAWLADALEKRGARLEWARVTSAAWRRIQQGSRRASVFGVQFDGVLVCADPTLLLEAVHAGIGPGKGLGFGLLSLVRLKENA